MPTNHIHFGQTEKRKHIKIRVKGITIPTMTENISRNNKKNNDEITKSPQLRGVKALIKQYDETMF